LHLTLKREATKPAGDNLLRQQARFDALWFAKAAPTRLPRWQSDGSL